MFQMFKRMGKRTSILAVLGLLVVTGSALAYFTATSSGTGSSQAQLGTGGAASQALVLHATMDSVSPPLTPGSNTAVLFTVDNPNAEYVQLNSISITGVSSPNTACQAAIVASNGTSKPWFTYAGESQQQIIAPGNGNAVTVRGGITFHDDGTNQDACAGKTLNLSLTSN